MSRLVLGLICGCVFGAISGASMIPLKFPDKRAAMLGAFINRFSIGLVIGAARLPWPSWLLGLFFGLLLSLAGAIITKAYAPILAMGVVFGTVIGVVVQRFGHWGRAAVFTGARIPLLLILTPDSCPHAARRLSFRVKVLSARHRYRWHVHRLRVGGRRQSADPQGILHA